MIRVVFFGTPAISLKSLEYLYNSSNIEIVGVVTQPDKPAGRGHKLSMSVVKKFALEHNLPVFQPKSIRKEQAVIEALKALSPDFFVTFAFGQILSQEVLDIPKYETINLHASLLPKYRGANPIQRAIINGDKETGICTMITELGLDCGDICLKEVIPIDDNMNCEDLFNTISDLSPQLLERTLIGLADDSIKPVPQCDEGVCMAAVNLQSDICRVCGTKSEIAQEPSGDCIIIGSLKSELIKLLVKSGKIDVSRLEGKREKYLLQVIDSPVPGVGRALVIIGSDKRGTIYGIYELSRQMGVSPWYWWMDVPTQHNDNVYIKPGIFTDGEPKVKYRGIFIQVSQVQLAGFNL